MAATYLNFSPRHTFTSIDIYFAGTVEELLAVPNVMANAIGFVGSHPYLIPYIFAADRQWHTTIGDAVGPPGPAGADGEDGVGTGNSTGSVARTVSPDEIWTIENAYSLVVADYFHVEGNGILAIEGDGVLMVI